MSIALTELLQYIDDLLQCDRFRDYCPNGLQVEGRASVSRLAVGVTANQAFLDAAIAWGADAVLVHHGYFWKGEPYQVTGMKKRRLAALLNADVSLLAYHLPLDAHPELGNNACLGRLMGLGVGQPLQPDDPAGVGNIVRLDSPRPVKELLDKLAEITARVPLHIGDDGAEVQTVAWCTGAAQSYLETAIAAGADMFITGEVSEPTVHIAREEGVHFVAAGHHATERYGVQALGEHLQSHFGLQSRYFEVDNPV
jgi:dinuclear metal center YbgI/SA1388 family protein